jgi:phasin family protein
MAEPKAANPIVKTKAEAPVVAPVATQADAPRADVALPPQAKATPAATAPTAAEAAPKTPLPVNAAVVSVQKSVPAKSAAPAVKKAALAPKPAAVAEVPAAKAATVKKTVTPVRAGIEKQGVKIMATKTETPFIGADQFKNAFGDVNERAKVAMEKSAKIVEEFADLTRGNVEAIVASSKVAAKGVETLSQEAAEFGRKSFEDASAAFKSFAEVKSATDFFKLQSDFARSAFDAAVAESAKVSEAVLKIAGDVAEPITSRYSVAAERVKTLAA